jgi:hypothetical protein
MIGNSLVEWAREDVADHPHLHSRVKRNSGIGRLDTFRPWLGLRDEPGDGTAGVPKGLLTGRRHQFRTTAARAYGFMLERSGSVVDIREIFPIFDFERTLKICGRWGCRHEYEKVHVAPFLIDFVITVRQGEGVVDVARSLMPASGKLNGRLAEKFRVQYEWCKQVGLHWAPVDSSNLNDDLVKSLVFIRQWMKAGYEPDVEAAQGFADLFRRVRKPHDTLMEVVERCSSRGGESYERCLDHFRYAVWCRALKVDLTKTIILNQPVVLLGDD